jgi:hypothetical protein
MQPTTLSGSTGMYETINFIQFFYLLSWCIILPLIFSFIGMTFELDFIQVNLYLDNIICAKKLPAPQVYFLFCIIY